MRFTGDVERRDLPALEALGLDLAPLTRVHVDLGGLEFGGVTLVSWLLKRQRVLGDLGGRLTLGRTPRRFARVLKALNLAQSFEVAEPACEDATTFLRDARTTRTAPGARLAAASP